MKLRLLSWMMVLLMLLSACARPNAEEEKTDVEPPVQSETGAAKEHRLKSEWKSPAITNAQRKEFYEWVVDYRMDAVPEFKAGETIDLDWMKYYCIHFIEEKDREYVSGGTNFSGPDIEKIANDRFGMSYGLKEGDVVFMKAEGGRSEPMVELIGYKTKNVDGKTLVTARYVEYFWNEYANYTYPSDNPNYPRHRKEIFEGSLSDYDWYGITDISYYTEPDGKTPRQFVSCWGYGYQALEEGRQTLPDFSSL